MFFVPITKISKALLENGKDKKLRYKDNLIFFQDISKYSLKEYKASLIKKYKILESENDYIDDPVH